MIGILDYGLGNIRAFSNIYKALDIPFIIVNEKKELDKTSKLILPGVGAFDDAMKKFKNSGLKNKVESMVLENQVPILGVCVGLQMLGNSSDEGKEKGLGWIDAEVKIFDYRKIEFSTKLPHMGWNSININDKNNPLFSEIDDGDRFYFLHSYYFKCNKKENILAECTYGSTFTCATRSNNIFGVQFHPEKSHVNGEKLLYNFSTI